MTPLTPRRRKIAALAGATAAIAGSLNTLHRSNASETRYTVFGVLTGLAVGCVILLFKRKRNQCAAQS